MTSAPRITGLAALYLTALLGATWPALAQEEAPAAAGEPAAAEAAAETPEAAEAVRPASEVEYVTALVTHIRRERLNVSALRETGLTGRFTTRIGFSTGHDGRLVSSRVVTSSGSALFDNVAMAQLRAAEPFPLFAVGMDETPREYSIDIATVIEAKPAPEAEADPATAAGPDKTEPAAE